MPSKDNFARALKGSIYYSLIHVKTNYVIFSFILMGNVIIQALLSLLMLQGGNSSNNGGILTVGFTVAIIFMFVTAIVLSGTKELKTNLAFPTDRRIISLVRIIMFCIMILGFLVLTSIAYVFEYIIFSSLAAVFKGLTYINFVTPESFIVGFWISFCYIMFTTSLTYFCFALFNRFKLPAISIFSFIMVALVATAIGRQCLYNAWTFFIEEQSILMLSIKLLVCIATAHILRYLVQRKMEVNK